MNGSPAVIEALQRLYNAWKSLEEEAHLIEHRLESQGWSKLSDWFDDIEDRGHKECIHKLMNRMNALGAEIRPGYAFEPRCWGVDDLETAASDVLTRLGEVRADTLDAANAATDADDVVTHKMLVKQACWIESRIIKFERRLSKIRIVGLRDFLAEMMD